MLVGGTIGTFLGAQRAFQEKWDQDKWGHAKVWTLIASMVGLSQYIDSVWIRGVVGLGMGYVLGHVVTHL